jgi:hypothetical protein
MNGRDRGIKLKTINTWLRRIGLVLVLEVDDAHERQTLIRIERARSYDHRTAMPDTRTR